MTRIQSLAKIVALCVFIPTGSWALDEVIVQGSIICHEDSTLELEMPVSHVWVKSKGVAGDPVQTYNNGYYRLSRPLSCLVDRTLTLLCVDSGRVVGHRKKFVAYEDLKMVDGQQFLQFPTVMLDLACDSLTAYDAWLDVVLPRETDSLDDIAPHIQRRDRRSSEAGVIGGVIGVLVGGAALLMSTMQLGEDATIMDSDPGRPDTITVDFLGKADVLNVVRSGLLPEEVFLHRLGCLSGGMGFSASPARNHEVVTVANPSAGAHSTGWNADVCSDLSGYSAGQLHGSFEQGGSVGARFSTYSFETDYEVETSIGKARSREERNRNTRLDLWGSGCLGHGFSVGASVSLNSIKYSTLDQAVIVKTYNSHFDLTDTSASLQFSDKSARELGVDIFGTWELTKQIQLGAAVLHLAGSRLSGEATVESPRVGVVGGLLRLSRWNLGIDAFYSEAFGADVALGLNVVPADHARLAIGYNSMYERVSYELHYRFLSYSLIGNIDGDSNSVTHLIGIHIARH
jgi:hypothetical protein